MARSRSEDSIETAANELEYVGFWARLWASVIDTVLVIVITAPLLQLLPGERIVSGAELFDPGDQLGSPSDLLLAYASHQVNGVGDFLVSFVLPICAVIGFWIARQATPGKMAISARIVDAQTGLKPSAGQAIGRYFGYFLSTFAFGLGFLWIGLDPRKQGWHDKLAGTVVVRPRRRGVLDVRFPASESQSQSSQDSGRGAPSGWN